MMNEKHDLSMPCLMEYLPPPSSVITPPIIINAATIILITLKTIERFISVNFRLIERKREKRDFALYHELYCLGGDFSSFVCMIVLMYDRIECDIMNRRHWKQTK